MNTRPTVCIISDTALITGIVALGAAAGYIALYGPSNFTILYNHWPGLLSAALANAIVQAIYVYVASFQGKRLLALGGNSGNVLFDVGDLVLTPVVHWPRAQPSYRIVRHQDVQRAAPWTYSLGYSEHELCLLAVHKLRLRVGQYVARAALPSVVCCGLPATRGDDLFSDGYYHRWIRLHAQCR